MLYKHLNSLTYKQKYGKILLFFFLCGKIIKKKVPMKVRDYVEGKIVGEHYEYVEVEEETQPNPYLLKFLAENKLSEKCGGSKKDSADEHREVIENMTEDEINAIKEYKDN